MVGRRKKMFRVPDRGNDISEADRNVHKSGEQIEKVRIVVPTRAEQRSRENDDSQEGCHQKPTLGSFATFEKSCCLTT